MSNNAMSNETDLDWLARNVHVWPAGDHQPWCYVYIVAGGAIKASGNFLDAVACPTMVTKDQWLARRAELQNKPSWDDAPEWAVYMAQSPNGHWEFFAVKPRAEGWWRHQIGERSSANNASIRGAILGDWRDTLEKRQEQDEFEPFVSVEDSKEQDMKQDNGWFERWDLPPVGMAVQLWHGGTYAYDCELIAKRGNNFVLWNLTWDRPDSADCMMCEFKPIPTERDVLIEVIKKTDDTDDKIADAILAAGFKRGAA